MTNNNVCGRLPLFALPSPMRRWMSSVS